MCESRRSGHLNRVLDDVETRQPLRRISKRQERCGHKGERSRIGRKGAAEVWNVAIAPAIESASAARPSADQHRNQSAGPALTNRLDGASAKYLNMAGQRQPDRK